jgi:pimeloyl-ACP methyl ester carboxylesterase
MTSAENTNPSVVLVHGAYADGSSWSEVIKCLQDAGIAATAVQNLLTSLADDAEHTRRILALQPGPVILAGHSFAGTVITEAGTHPAVAALVYVAARAPAAGEDYAALAGRFRAPPASAGLVYTDGFGALTEDAFLHDYADGVEPALARVLYAVQERVSETLFRGPGHGGGLAVTAGLVRGLPPGSHDLARAAAVHGRAHGRDDRRDRFRPPLAGHPPGRSDRADHERRPGRPVERHGGRHCTTNLGDTRCQTGRRAGRPSRNGCGQPHP